MRERTKTSHDSPKQRLLRAGEELFALVGYRRATIREICERANVNVAMVNYYFGGKQHLYRTVLERSMEESFQRHVSSSRPPSSAPPEERLRAFVVALLAHVLDETDYNSSGRLMAREMVEPTFALDIVVDKIIRPWSAEAGSIARAFLGPHATDDEVFLFEQPVIVGQCLHYRHNRPILDRLHPSLRCGPENVNRLADHITRFTLGALRAFRPRAHGHDHPAVRTVEQTSHRTATGGSTERPKAQQSEPRERLLTAGEELFALLGYRHATIREICQRANVNIAMINYYFDTKEELYRTVLERSLRQSVERHVAASRPPDNATPEERLYAFVFALLSHVLEEGGSAAIGQLMSREMTEPTFALEAVVDTVIRPRSEQAISIVRAFLGPDADEEDVILCEQSIVAQCLHYRHNRPIMDRLRPWVKYGPDDVTPIAREITRVCIGALRAYYNPADSSIRLRNR